MVEVIPAYQVSTQGTHGLHLLPSKLHLPTRSCTFDIQAIMNLLEGGPHNTVATRATALTMIGPTNATPICLLSRYVAITIWRTLAHISSISCVARIMASTCSRLATYHGCCDTYMNAAGLTSVLISVTAAALSMAVVLRSVERANMADTRIPRSMVTVRVAW